MSETEYLKRKGEFDTLSKIIHEEIERLGFSDWWGGAGDFSQTRLFKNNKSYDIWCMTMEGDYWNDEYPDNQFYAITKTGMIPINSIEDLHKYVSSENN